MGPQQMLDTGVRLKSIVCIFSQKRDRTQCFCTKPVRTNGCGVLFFVSGAQEPPGWQCGVTLRTAQRETQTAASGADANKENIYNPGRRQPRACPSHRAFAPRSTPRLPGRRNGRRELGTAAHRTASLAVCSCEGQTGMHGWMDTVLHSAMANRREIANGQHICQRITLLLG